MALVRVSGRTVLRTMISEPPERQVREDVVRYLEVLGANRELEGWPYAQAVEALQIFSARAARSTWSKEMDWWCLRVARRVRCFSNTPSGGQWQLM